ncbi:MAG TPA: helix-turn-helix transcriptional regulator [Nitrospirales bacterium]|nr:helix-turn-helix transcriptional regulator [Nitrospirales bacterium]
MPREHGRWPLLTPRHREVLVLIVRGMTSREIAVELGISRRTVEVHRTNIMRRLGARNVSDLFREALLQRLIPKRYWRKGVEAEPAPAPASTASPDPPTVTVANTVPAF